MKKIRIAGLSAGMTVFLLVCAAASAADLEMQLDSDAGTSAVSVKNASAAEKVRLDATGAVDASGAVSAPNFVSGAASGTQPYAATSTTLNTNLNADLWDNQNLPALSSGQYLTNDGSSLSWATPGPTVKSGIAYLSAGGTATVTFATPFASVPRVVATAQFSTTDTSTTFSCYNVTVNGFTLRGAGNAAGNVAWIATDANNS